MILFKTLIFTALVPGSATLLIPYLLLSSGGELRSLELGFFQFLGFPLIILGVVFYLWCAWNFTFTGRGTPAPFDPPSVFVARGLYRVVRNPMYVGMLTIFIGEGIAFGSLTLFTYAVFFWTLFHLFVRFYEEPTLKKKFGASYEAYCRSVPRWIPGKIRD